MTEIDNYISEIKKDLPLSLSEENKETIARGIWDVGEDLRKIRKDSRVFLLDSLFNEIKAGGNPKTAISDYQDVVREQVTKEATANRAFLIVAVISFPIFMTLIIVILFL